MPLQLTALGFVCLLMSSLLSVAFVGIQSDKSDREVAPFAIASAILILCYMILDNTDGKQARRTQTSSPLGELIDHGSDSMTVGVSFCALYETGIGDFLLRLLFFFNVFLYRSEP